jgi:DNA-binding transcriptional regulator YiaG
MTPSELKSIRHSLGLSAEAFAKLVKVESGRTVRRWEAGDRDIPGPVQVLAGAIMESPAVRRHFGLSIKANSAT